MRISDGSSDVCSPVLAGRKAENVLDMLNGRVLERSVGNNLDRTRCAFDLGCRLIGIEHADHDDVGCSWGWGLVLAVTLGESGIGREKRSGKGAGRKQQYGHDYPCRSEEHTSELQSLMRNSYA